MFRHTQLHIGKYISRTNERRVRVFSIFYSNIRYILVYIYLPIVFGKIRIRIVIPFHASLPIWYKLKILFSKKKKKHILNIHFTRNFFRSHFASSIIPGIGIRLPVTVVNKRFYIKLTFSSNWVKCISRNRLPSARGTSHNNETQITFNTLHVKCITQCFRLFYSIIELVKKKKMFYGVERCFTSLV